MTTFGCFVRERRESLREDDPAYSIRRVAQRMGIQPSYLSKVERDEVAPPSEKTTVKLAKELKVDHNELLARAGKLSSDVQKLIRERPVQWVKLIQDYSLKPDMPDDAVLRLVREVRDGEW